MSGVPGRTIVPCPRCGYDLGGVIERWGAEGFGSGRCSECGHDVDLAMLARQGIRAARLAESRRRDFIEVGNDRWIKRFLLTSLRATSAIGMFPWINRRQLISGRRLAWFVTAWMLIWPTCMCVPAIIGSMANIGPIAVDWLIAMPFFQVAILATAWVVSVVGTWFFTRPWFRGPRTDPEPYHFLRVAIYGACGLMAAHTVLCLYQAAVVIIGHAILTEIPFILLLPAWLLLGLGACVWTVAWIAGAASNYFGCRV